MKKTILALGIGGAILIPEASLQAGFGDAVVGGVVGGVVGSVITNGIYHSGRRHSSHRRTYRKKHRAPKPVMTNEKRIQIALQNLGFYHGPIDGQINSFPTRNAIRDLNRAYEIGDTAYMSPQERDALVYLGNLLQMDKNLVSQGSDRRSRTRRIQAALQVLGFYNGKIDGSTGPMTRRAISAYRAANGYAPGYRLGYEDEYRLIQTAKQANDRNLNDTIASLKRLGGGQGTNRMRPAPRANQAPQPVILQPSQPQPPMQGTITQEAPAPQPVAAPAPVSPAPQPVMSPVPAVKPQAPVAAPAPAPAPAASLPQPQPKTAPQPQSEAAPQPVVLQPASPQ